MRAAAAPVALALVLRALVILACDREVADVARYQKVARHLLEVSWNPYETRRLYPYPPPWALVEAGAGWLDRQGVLRFAVAVKLPVLAADLLLVALLSVAARAGRASPLSPWLYAVHPVAILVGAAHGQFDAIALLLLLVAIDALRRGRRAASALALAGAVATKSFPVLMLPLLAAAGRPTRAQLVRYLMLAAAPVALVLAPFAVADVEALRRELFAYSGVADFGWTGVARGLEWLTSGSLPRSEARFWPAASLVSKALFLAAWLAIVLALRLGRLRLDAAGACLAVVLAFLGLYGLLSAQYLLWAVPLSLLRPCRFALAYALCATPALVGFYLLLAPGVLAPGELAAGPARLAGHLWWVGSSATLLVSLLWLASLLRSGWTGRSGALEP